MISKVQFRIGCDIGGTFTDVVLHDCATGGLHLYKLLSTLDQPADAVVAGITTMLKRHGVPDDASVEVLHASTLANNIVLERKGAPVGLLATKGFRDVIEMRRQERYDMYDIMLDVPEPLVPRRRRKDIGERISRDGEVLRPLSKADIAAAIEEFRSAGVHSVAVSYLHSYRNPCHEVETKAEIDALAPGMSISLSSEVLPQIREYERTSTTIVDAYVKPYVVAYLDSLSHQLSGIGIERLSIMLSGGSVSSVETARRHPVRLIESGPSAGVLAVQHYAGLLGLKDCIAFDVGGTTAKAGLILGGEPLKTSTYEVAHAHRFKRGSGIPIQLPAINLMEIGAGGGSIASIDALGLLEVGPESAGSVPGPACYGRGGGQPTVSDADLVLGYLDAQAFAGGEMTLSTAAAFMAIKDGVAEKLGIDVIEAAKGIHDLVNEKMAVSTRMYCLENGEDPAQLTLVASGGAGPVHGYGVARKLGIARVVIPPTAGTMSAAGLLTADTGFDLVSTVNRPLDEASVAYLRDRLERIADEAAGILGADRKDVLIASAAAEMRYVGQGFEIAVKLPAEPELSPELVRAAFDETYARLYGRHLGELPVEIAGLRVEARLARPSFGAMRRSETAPSATMPISAGVRTLYFPGYAESFEALVYDRGSLSPGTRFSGPAIVRDPETSSVVGPDCTVTIDPFGGLSLELAYPEDGL